MGQPSDGWIERGLASVRASLGGEWAAAPIHGTGGGAFGSRVFRLRSDDESVVVEVVARNDVAIQDPSSWLREVEV